jgi:hypothetical protein
MRQTAGSYVGLAWFNYSTPFPPPPTMRQTAGSYVGFVWFGSVSRQQTAMSIRFGKISPLPSKQSYCATTSSTRQTAAKMVCFGFTPLTTISRPGRQLTCQFGFWFFLTYMPTPWGREQLVLYVQFKPMSFKKYRVRGNFHSSFGWWF